MAAESGGRERCARKCTRTITCGWVRSPVLFTSIAVFVVTLVAQGTAASRLCFSELTVTLLQRHIKISRHLPICLIYRRHNTGSKLEDKFCKFWSKRNEYQLAGVKNYSTWEVGAYASDKNLLPTINIPKEIPTLRCHLGPMSPQDFNGRLSRKGLAVWFTQLAKKHAYQLREATVDVVIKTVSGHPLTLLGFSDDTSHYEFEDVLMQVREKIPDNLALIFIHPHSPDIQVLSSLYNITDYPSVAFIEPMPGSKSGRIIRLVSGWDVNYRTVHTFVQTWQSPATSLTEETFPSYVLDIKAMTYVPVLVCFYSDLLNSTVPYMQALARTAGEFRGLRFGLVDLTKEMSVLYRHVDQGQITTLPFNMLYYPNYKGKQVSSIKQRVLNTRPTPLTIWEFTQNINGVKLDLVDNDDLQFYTGRPQKRSMLSEGPYGSGCYKDASNTTDNDPVPFPKINRIKKKKVPTATLR